MNTEIKEAKYKGELDLAGNEMDCYVLEDGERYLSSKGMQYALKIVEKESQKKRGPRLKYFLAQKSLEPFLYKGKERGHFEPTVFYYKGIKINGCKATLLPDLCDGMLEARRSIKLKGRQEIVANQCEILMRAFAKVGIVALVDEATGYQKVRQETLQEILRVYVSEEVLKWQKTFHDGFYEQIFRLWNWVFDPENKKKPLFVGYLTIKLVYENLPEGVLEKIKEKNPRTEKGRWKYHFHRWLTLEVGKEALKKVIYTIETLAKISKDKNQFLRLVKKVCHPDKDLPSYIDIEAMNESKETKVDKVLKALLKTPKKKKDEK